MAARISSCFLGIQISSIYDRWDKSKESSWSLTIFYRNMGSHQRKTWRPFGNQTMDRHCCCQAPMAIWMVIWGNEAEAHGILVSPILLLWQILWPKWLLRVKDLFYFTVHKRGKSVHGVKACYYTKHWLQPRKSLSHGIHEYMMCSREHVRHCLFNEYKLIFN